MRRRKAEGYLRFVWARHGRQPWLTPELVLPVYDCIETSARRLGCTVLALGGMPDHVYLVVMLPPKTAIYLLAQQAKGASSKLAAYLSRPQQNAEDGSFRWQEGYGVFSLSRTDLPKVVDYVQNQARHHSGGKLWATLEEADEEAAQ